MAQNPNKKQVEQITDMEVDFAQWYTDVCKKAELIDYSSIKGMFIYRPYGYAIWENIQREMDRRFKETGHENVYLPMLIPGMITLGVFTFNSYWNSYMWPSIVISSEENMVVALALQDFETYVGTDYGALMAGSLLICLPVLALFIAAQKFFLTDVQLVGASKE